MKAAQLVARIRRRLRPPRIRRVSSRPAGWLAVGRRRLEPIVAWALYDDGCVRALVADRRGLRPAMGWKFRGYLPGAARSSRDVQLAPPAVSVPVADLEEAIGPLTDVLTEAIADPDPPTETAWRALDAVYNRLEAAARAEWAIDALCAFVVAPKRFLQRHLELVVEHAHAAELDPTERAFLASLATSPETSARPGPGEGARP